MATVNVKLPLMAHEKLLIDNFRDLFLTQEELPQPPPEKLLQTFHLWRWRNEAEMWFVHILGVPDYRQLHQGRWPSILDCFTRLLPSPHNYTLRTESILEANSTHGDVDLAVIEEVVAHPLDADLPYWNILAIGLQAFRRATPQYESPFSDGDEDKDPAMWEDWEEVAKKADALGEEICEKARDQNWKFEIWSLLRSWAIIERSKMRGEMLSILDGVAMTDFHKIYDQVKNGYIKRSRDNSENPPERTGLHFTQKAFRLWSFQDDPRKYLEHLPWSELEECQAPPAAKDLARLRFARWSSRYQYLAEHMIVSEEDVFAHCITNNIQFPGDVVNQSRCFVMTPIGDLEFGRGAYHYLWNDCAVTENPLSNQWFLLQTLAGYRYRAKYAERANDDAAAKTALRNWTQREIDKLSGRPLTDLREALNMDYNPEYEDLLTLIPAEEIQAIYGTAGSGTRGVVYKALWARPKRIGEFTSQKTIVALKTMKAARQANLVAFIKELDVTFQAVQGRSIRVVDFYGILKTPHIHQGDSPLLSLPTATLFLVSEFCDQESLLRYLGQTFKGSFADWKTLLAAIAEIAIGLEELHKHSVIHRDLHSHNVLVKMRHYSRDSAAGADEPVILIADLGEAKALDSISRPRHYGNPRYWAPEVIKDRKYSKASDIYAFGYLVYEMLVEKWKKDEGPASDRQVPMPVFILMMACWKKIPEDRPTAQQIMDDFEDLERSWGEENSDELSRKMMPMDLDTLDMIFDALRGEGREERGSDTIPSDVSGGSHS